MAEQFVYHLTTTHRWAVDPELDYAFSTLDQTLDEVGFIHFSFARQVPVTAKKFYQGVEDLVLLTIDAAALGDALKSERLDGATQEYPHLYGALPRSAVVSVTPWEGQDLD